MIYDGLKPLGAVHESRGGMWAAVGADGGLIGMFPNARAATDAVLLARAVRDG